MKKIRAGTAIGYSLSSCILVLAVLGCESNPTSNQDSQLTRPATIVISDYDLPESITTWEYQYSDGTTLNSSSVISLPNGRKGYILDSDTMVMSGNNIIELRYRNGVVIEFRYGGLLLEPYSIADGQTYTKSSSGYYGDNAILTFKVETKYSLEYNVTVGTTPIDTMLFAQMKFITTATGTGQVATTYDYGYRGKNLGILKSVDSSGNVLKIVTRLTGNGQILFP